MDGGSTDGTVESVKTQSVSYTHLDVYKRQLQYTLFYKMTSNIKVIYITKYKQKEILKRPDNFAYYIKSMMNTNFIDAVSYTHLDVYKRQVLLQYH